MTKEFKKMNKEGLQKAREILDKLRNPIVPSDELVSIVREISESNEKIDNEKEDIAARPLSEINR